MLDPRTMAELAKIRQQELLGTASRQRYMTPLIGSPLADALSLVVAAGKRLTHAVRTAPAQTAPDLAEPCFEC